MTTIAIKDGIISYDSQCTAGDRIESLKYDKKHSLHGYHFFSSGSVSDIEKLIAVFFDERSLPKPPKNGSLQATTYVVTPEKDVYMCGFYDDELWMDHIGWRECTAIGSGSAYAIGAMDAGATAQEAVKIACGRDIYSGGRIRTFKI